MPGGNIQKYTEGTGINTLREIWVLSMGLTFMAQIHFHNNVVDDDDDDDDDKGTYQFLQILLPLFLAWLPLYQEVPLC